MAVKNKNNWICDLCNQEKDTLYFHGKKQICEECRKKVRCGNGSTNKTKNPVC